MLSHEELENRVQDTIKETNGQTCVIDLGITVDDITAMSRDAMVAIEEAHNLAFICIGNIVLIKVENNHECENQ